MAREHKMIALDKIEPCPPGHVLYTGPTHETLVDLIVRAQTGEIPTTRTTAQVKELAVHDATALVRAQAAIREEPTLGYSLAANVIAGRTCWPVYRNAAGALVVFDDYIALAAMLTLQNPDGPGGVVPVKILGEGPDTA